MEEHEEYSNVRQPISHAEEMGGVGKAQGSSLTVYLSLSYYSEFRIDSANQFTLRLPNSSAYIFACQAMVLQNYLLMVQLLFNLPVDYNVKAIERVKSISVLLLVPKIGQCMWSQLVCTTLECNQNTHLSLTGRHPR